MASLLQELLGLADSTSHGRAGHGEEIGLVVAYAEGFCAGIHLQGEEDAGCKVPVGPAAHPRHGVSLESSTWLCPGVHPRVFSVCSSPQRSLGPWRLCTSSLKGRGGTVLSRLNMSSHSSALMHSARLSTSFAIGPTAAATGRDHKRESQLRVFQGHVMKKQNLLALFCLNLVLATAPL